MVVAPLLVSADFLASEFVMGKEVPALLRAAVLAMVQLAVIVSSLLNLWSETLIADIA